MAHFEEFKMNERPSRVKVDKQDPRFLKYIPMAVMFASCWTIIPESLVVPLIFLLA